MERKFVCPRNRFEISRKGENSLDGYDLIDNKYNKVLSFTSYRKAQQAAGFAREYVRIHGDIDFDSFPYSLDEPYEPSEESDRTQFSTTRSGTNMMDYYDVKFGARVLTQDGRTGTIIYVGSGAMSNVVEVRGDDGRATYERGHTLRKAD